MNFIKTLTIVLALNFSAIYAVETSAEIIKFNPEQHKEAVLKIIEDDAAYLAYETLGSPKGTTEKYLISPKYTTNVLVKDGAVIGFINYISVDWTFLTFNLGRVAMIHLMGVDKNHRREGYGKLLFNHAVTELNKSNVPKVLLFVKKENTNAIRLYEQAGFNCPFDSNMQKSMPQLIYEKKFDVPEHLLPQGNVIQRYPKTALTALSAGTAAALYYHYCGSK